VFTEYPEIFPQGIKRLGGDVDHSPVSSSDVKDEWSHTLQFPCMIRGFYGEKRTVLSLFPPMDVTCANTNDS
jgi:hypothetical protein